MEMSYFPSLRHLMITCISSDAVLPCGPRRAIPILSKGRFRLGAVAQILRSNDSIPVDRSLAIQGIHVAADRPDMTFVQTFGGLIPN